MHKCCVLWLQGIYCHSLTHILNFSSLELWREKLKKIKKRHEHVCFTHFLMYLSKWQAPTWQKSTYIAITSTAL
jgi:hypothetical protein